MTTSLVSKAQRRAILRDPLHLLSFGLGTGFVPVAPGTAGTLLALPIALGLSYLGFEIYLLVTAALTVLGIWACERTVRLLGVHDHRGIVLDEIAGYLITMLLLPKTWAWLLAGFFLFRFFDILKPQPIRWLDQRVHGGLGVMLDDVAAGIYGLVCLLVANWLLNG